MRVVINEKRVKRSRQIAQISFFVAFGLLIGGLIVTNNPTDILTALLPLLILPIALAATIFSVQMANRWLREPRPEAVIKKGLKGIGSRSELYHYYMPIDHALFTPYGVFSLTIRPQEGTFHIDGERWRREGGLLSKVNTFFRQDHVGLPHRHAQRDAAKLQKLIDNALPESGVTVQPVVVMVSDRAELGSVENPPVPVVHVDLKNKQSLKRLIQDYKKSADLTPLDQEQIAQVAQAAGVPAED